MDRVIIKDLILRCIIGVYPEERRAKQDVVVNITLFADLRKAGRSDDLADTVDYKELREKIIDFVEPSSYCLIESVAEGVAAICLEADGVQKVIVRVDKPGALRFTRSVAVEIERPQPD
jgi:FolB domain-containing protein